MNTPAINRLAVLTLVLMAWALGADMNRAEAHHARSHAEVHNGQCH